MDLQVKDKKGKVVGSVEASDKVWAAPSNDDLLHQAVIAQQANKRQGTQDTQTRAEVSFSTRKIRPQKGTGQARQGSRRSPNRVGGGVAHGPHPRSFRQRLPKKMRRQALRVALSDKVREDAVTVIDVLKVDAPKSSVSDLFKHVKGPDFPTDAEIITPQQDLLEIYQTGTGSVRMRAVWEKEEGSIVITALPYQSAGDKILVQIAAQMQAKKLPMLEDLRDESDHENPTRLVLVPRSNRINLEDLMSHLFATTDLERSYRVNLNMIGINGQPRVKDLKTILQEWLKYRTETVRRRVPVPARSSPPSRLG